MNQNVQQKSGFHNHRTPSKGSIKMEQVSRRIGRDLIENTNTTVKDQVL